MSKRSNSPSTSGARKIRAKIREQMQNVEDSTVGPAGLSESNELCPVEPALLSVESSNDLFSSAGVTSVDLFQDVNLSSAPSLSVCTPPSSSGFSFVGVGSTQMSCPKLMPLVDAIVPTLSLPHHEDVLPDEVCISTGQPDQLNLPIVESIEVPAPVSTGLSDDFGTMDTSSTPTECPTQESELCHNESLYDLVLSACFEPMGPAPVDTTNNANCCEHSEEDISDTFNIVQDIHPPVPRGSQLLYANAPITVQESLIATLTLALSENLSGSTLERILKFVMLHLPKPNLFTSSTFNFYNNLETQASPVKLFYYCTACFRIRKSAEDICDECKVPKKSVNYFIYFSVTPQIKKLFTRSKFREGLKYKDTRVKINEDNIEDIYDTEVYKKFECKHRPQGKKKISLGWNSDGISPYNSSSYSLSPFYFCINELAPSERFKKENVIVGGLWGGKEKPCPNIFLVPLQEEISHLRENGIDVEIDGKVENYDVDVIWGTCDTPAKAIFLNMKAHNGFYSCPKCFIMGESEEATVFPHQDVLELRTDDNYLETMKYVIATKNNKDKAKDKKVAGFNGVTILNFMVTDILKSTSVDYMHAVCLGVMRQILILLFTSTHREKPFSLYAKVDQVNSKLLSVRLPHFVDRDLLPVDKISFMKASVLKNLLSHVLLCVLSGVMTETYFEHFRIFVAGRALLNSNSVSQNDISVADVLLCKFVKEFQSLYGLRHMSFNMHLLRHLPQCVSETGPLSLTSCFEWENLNGDLLTLTHGTRHAGLQIANNLSLLTELPEKIVNLLPGPTKTFCEQLTTKFSRLQINEWVDCDTFTVGKYVRDNNFHDALSASNNTLLFSRLWKKKLFVAESYGKGSRDSSNVKYIYNNESTFGKIMTFAKIQKCSCLSVCSCDGDFVAVIQNYLSDLAFTINEFEGEIIAHVPNMYKFCCSNVVHVVPVQNLICVCFKIENYISEPLNKYELK